MSTKAHEKLREEIAQQTQAFLARNKTITIEPIRVRKEVKKSKGTKAHIVYSKNSTQRRSEK